LRRLLRQKPNKTVRAASQHAVHDELVATSFKNKPNFSSLSEKQLRRAYELIDEHLMGGNLGRLLRKEGRQLTFRVAPRMTSRAGQLLTEQAHPKKHELAISSTLLCRTFSQDQAAVSRIIVVNGYQCLDRASALLRVLEHEMIHLLFCCEAMPEACRKQGHHGELFRKTVAQLFGHTDFRHDLVTPREQASVVNGVEAGCTVRFTLGRETLDGRVNRVTKRATILVSCNNKHPEAREFSDGKHYRKFFIPVEHCMVLKRPPA